SEAHRLDPDPKYLSARGWVHFRLGRREAALADWMASVVPDASDHWSLYREAALRLELGDRERYLEVCSALLERFSSATDPYVVERSAKACLTSGDPDLDRERLGRLAERAHAAEPDLAWFLLTRGIAHYRLGQRERSLDALRECLEGGRGG